MRVLWPRGNGLLPTYPVTPVPPPSTALPIMLLALLD